MHLRAGDASREGKGRGCCGIVQGGREGLAGGLSRCLGGFIRTSDSVRWGIFGVRTYVCALVL